LSPDEYASTDDLQERKRETVSSLDLRKLALNALDPIEKKLQGMEAEKQISVSNQVDKLIQEATSLQKLVRSFFSQFIVN
jgi:FATC domain